MAFRAPIDRAAEANEIAETAAFPGRTSEFHCSTVVIPDGGMT
jgi:hypothetical protein